MIDRFRRIFPSTENGFISVWFGFMAHQPNIFLYILWRCINNYFRMRVYFMCMWRRGQSGTWPSAKISPSQDSYFGHMVNWQIMWGLIWGWTDLRRWQGCFQFTFTYPTMSFVFLPPQITEKVDFKVRKY